MSSHYTHNVINTECHHGEIWVMILHKNKSEIYKNQLLSFCQNLWFAVSSLSRWQAGIQGVCLCVPFEVSCHSERMMKSPSAWWNTSAAPFSHALCLFKVTSQRGICIGKRNSECCPAALSLHVGACGAGRKNAGQSHDCVFNRSNNSHIF